MSDTFCILPWIHMSITPGGFVRLCCQSSEYVPMSLYLNTIDEIWNSKYLRFVRHKMVEGEEVNACKGCYTMEKQLGTSNRISSNAEWIEMIGSFDALLHASIENNYKILDPPISFHLIPGILCNLKCRMCSTMYSSQIQRDPIHAQWSPPKRFLEPEVLQWRAGEISIGPEPIVGVTTSGFYEPELHNNRILRWTQGDASLSFNVPQNLALQKLKIKIWEHHPKKYSFFQKLLLRIQRKNFKGHHLKVIIRDHPLFSDELANGAWEKNFDLSEKLYKGPVTVRLISDTFQVPSDQRDLGVAVENVEITCNENVKNWKHCSSSDTNRSLPIRPWYDDTKWIFNDLFRKPETLREIYFSGGEPMIQKQVEEIIDFCIDQQIAENVYLKFSTNCTILHESTLKKLSRFKKNFIALSIDGYGPYWEYIRYPGKWNQISNTISKLTKLSNTTIAAVPVLQVYNALNIAELLRFTDLMQLSFWFIPLTNPWFLSISVLPPKARTIAANRLREYAESNCGSYNSKQAMKMAHYIESVEDNCTTESLNTLMRFTNDLDITRNQSFQKTHGELFDLIAETGFRWTDERRYS